MVVTATRDMFGDDRPLPDFGSGGCPHRLGQVIRLHSRTGQRHLDWLRWGLAPSAAEHPDSAPRPTHASAETVAQLPMFAEAFRQRRAIVPATEYYQRRTVGGPGQRSSGEVVRTYCIIAVQATGAVADIHDRMPLVIEECDWAAWLGEVPGDPATLLRSSMEDALVVAPVQARRAAAPLAKGR